MSKKTARPGCFLCKEIVPILIQLSNLIDVWARLIQDFKKHLKTVLFLPKSKLQS